MDLDAILAPDSAFTTWARAQNLPCCTFVACALVEAVWGAPERRSVNAYVKLSGLDWWNRANVTDGESPWSALDAARSLSTTGYGFFDTNVKDHAPPLREGWNVVQRWKGLNGRSTPSPDDDIVAPGASGHTYFAYRDGDRVRIVQSSTKRGYRSTTGTWEGSAGLTGFSVGVTHIC